MGEKIKLDASKRTVLVVEDVDMNREILCELLKGEYNVVPAENGLAALEQLELYGGDISVILLDVYMPVLDGFGFLEEKRRDGRYDSLPVIVMTASNNVDVEIRCLSLGATDFVTKPYNIEVLKNRMLSVIRLRESAAMLDRLEQDRLTGLLSKEFFYLRAEEIMKTEQDVSFDIICSDIENFRTMNERYGQANCDQILRDMADRLTAALPGIRAAGRVDADMFSFLVAHRETWNDVLTEDIQQDSLFPVPMKYGVIQNVNRDLPVSTACDRASLAISRVKGRFNAIVAYYDDEMRQSQLRDHQLVECMQSSMENGEFQVYFQPKHDLKNDRTGGAEALVRWIHPELGFISPGVFIPLFEQNGFVTQLDFYVWEEVCRELRRCIDEGLPVVPVSVNVSRMDFDSPDLADRIIALVDRYALDRSLLHIELTESVYGDDPTRIAQAIQTLHENGFIIELDDFGSGYSALSSLNTLDLDVMKLDMSIIRQATATQDYAVLRFCLMLADGMRLKSVAEGVESAEEAAALKVLGCDYIQGYYYSRPLPRQDYEAYLLEHNGTGAA